MECPELIPMNHIKKSRHALEDEGGCPGTGYIEFDEISGEGEKITNGCHHIYQCALIASHVGAALDSGTFVLWLFHKKIAVLSPVSLK